MGGFTGSWGMLPATWRMLNRVARRSIMTGVNGLRVEYSWFFSESKGVAY